MENAKAIASCVSLKPGSETSLATPKVSLNGFHISCTDRHMKDTGKSRGHGLAAYVNDTWCKPGHITVRTQVCSRNVELLGVGLWPYLMPQRFSHAIVLVVYAPPSADAATTTEQIHSGVSKLITDQPNAFIAISGKFNHVSLSFTLKSFSQYVECKTRQ